MAYFPVKRVISSIAASLLLLVGLFFLLSSAEVSAQTPSESWPMAGANPERTSWGTNEVANTPNLEWYRNIEAFIPGGVSPIANYGKIYISSAKGLYVLDAATGEEVWRFNTELPLGHSPTVIDNVVYVGGYDKKLHALDAHNGTHLWSFQASAGFNTNPLVVDGRVILGNRDGALYAIGAHGTAQQGQQLWKFQTGAAIMFSAAYKNGVVYFVSNDSHAYAVRADNGTQVWKSAILPGDGFQSFWPVIYRDKVVFMTAISDKGGRHDQFDVFGDNYTEGVYIGTSSPAQPWSNGDPVMYPNRLLEYLENGPALQYHHKPWRRAMIVLNQSDGTEFTFDSDGDGLQEYAPFAFWHTNSGNMNPPIVGPTGLLYQGTMLYCCSDIKGKIYGWSLDNPQYLILLGSSINSNGNPTNGSGFGALAEPQVLSGGGNRMYYHRVGWGEHFSINPPGGAVRFWADGTLPTTAPGWDAMYARDTGFSKWYQGSKDNYPDTDFNPRNYNSTSGLYGEIPKHTAVPYQGRVYIFQDNSIFAYGSGQSRGRLPLIQVQPATQTLTTPSVDTLKQRLGVEIQKITAATPFLRPGYFVIGQHEEDFFSNPGDTVYTLALSYPHLSSTQQAEVRTYLQSYWSRFFDPTMYSTTGWVDGQQRESMPTVGELATRIAAREPQLLPTTTLNYPHQNFYALYLFAKNIPESSRGVTISRIYTLAKSKVRTTVPPPPTNFPGTVNVTPEEQYFGERSYELNAWITGYIGFLKLQELAGMQTTDATLRNQITTELNRLVAIKWRIFTKDSWVIDNPDARILSHQLKDYDIMGNFMWIVPEYGEPQYFGQDTTANQNIKSRMLEAFAEADYVVPYWMASRFESGSSEANRRTLWLSPALLQARAFVQNLPRQQLYKYLDAPAFERGDLFYIQNLVATIEAPDDPNYTPVPPTPTPVFSHGDVNGDGNVTIADLSILLANFGGTGKTRGQGDVSGNDGNVTIADLSTLLSNFGR